MPALNYNSGLRRWPESREEADAKIRKAYLAHLSDKGFPCVAAKAALGLNHVETFFATHLGCPADDAAILDFMYRFIDRFRRNPEKFSTVAIIFREAPPMPESLFDRLMWARLQALSDLDRRQFAHDPRVSADPASTDFSYSLKEEAFYIIGLHRGSSRPARQFRNPALVFNPHSQFEALRKEGKYEALKGVIRKRDILYSGSVNPMLHDFGEASEAVQYSGKIHDSGWACPLHHNANTYGDRSPA